MNTAGEKPEKTVIVSGATFGIGHEMALYLARSGFRVVGFGLEKAPVSSVAEASVADLNSAVKAEGLSAEFVAGDVTSESDVERAVSKALEYGDGIFGLVNNAAIGPLGTILDTQPDLFMRIMEVNLKGSYLMARAVIPHMRERGGGRIVNIGSGAGWGKPNMAAYSTSKGGLVALSKAMALDHFADGVAVNTVIPGGGGIISGMSLGRVAGDQEKLQSKAIGTVAGRIMNGSDMAGAVRFLLSEEAAAISGTIIDVGCFAHQGSSTPLPRRA
ncbi:SDR family NAD(P)-dependent oxidoreductase [Paracoccus aerodenitrificans]|uniref:SDR family NAD(P)-dependent oxidoreductase n=1 Tax=Paracoccus aerodenitrificans TaxID=3017781 RepID=UPI0022F04E5B|nr:SDR family oxidoreductase [Paracoccus aerodenitrificans]WBU63563.1 SDR family NAD(P)-dependent oxidoreductase [Paracoccus aerodenitrificans]